ncbi:MAG: ABC transporter substrate-binding protein [Candidatus Rokubacteria bacterium]|nr:ABC transporter substrate-binding protein [Candidatus Rokubacteria bacterium]
MTRATYRRALRAVVVALLAGAVGAGAQPAPARVGFLAPDEEPRFTELATALAQGLRERGHSDAQLVHGRVRRGDAAAARAGAEELVRQRASAVFVVGSALVRPVREVAPALPIVFITPGDPVAAGLVTSLAKPGRHTTAMTFEYPELSAKRLELLSELAPAARRILVIFDGRDPSPRQGLAAARTLATRLKLTLVERAVGSAAEVAPALGALDDADALLAIPGGAAANHYAAMVRAANTKRRPAIFHTRGAETKDALVTYGARDAEIARQAARLVDKVLKGADAGELPVERPARLTLSINQTTAKALGLTIPRATLARADEVVE